MIGEIIETKRLVLRPMTIDDAENAFSIWGNKDSGKYLSDPYYKSAEELRKLLADIKDWSDYQYIAEDKSTGDFVGTCSIGPEQEDSQWGFGYCVAENKRCCGYGTEIAMTMINFARRKGAHVCSAGVAKENIPSCRVLEKCGMHRVSESSFRKSGTDKVYESYIYKINILNKNKNRLFTKEPASRFKW